MLLWRFEDGEGPRPGKGPLHTLEVYDAHKWSEQGTFWRSVVDNKLQRQTPSDWALNECHYDF